MAFFQSPGNATAAFAAALADELLRGREGAGAWAEPLLEAAHGISFFLREDLRATAVARDAAEVLFERAAWASGLDAGEALRLADARAREDLRRIPPRGDPLLWFCIASGALRSLELDAAGGRIWVLELARLGRSSSDWGDPVRWPLLRRVLEALAPSLGSGAGLRGVGLAPSGDARSRREADRLREVVRYAEAVLERSLAGAGARSRPLVLLLGGK